MAPLVMILKNDGFFLGFSIGWSDYFSGPAMWMWTAPRSGSSPGVFATAVRQGMFWRPPKRGRFFPDQHYSRLCYFDSGHWSSFQTNRFFEFVHSIHQCCQGCDCREPGGILGVPWWKVFGRHIWSPDEWQHWPFRSKTLTLGFQNLGF